MPTRTTSHDYDQLCKLWSGVFGVYEPLPEGAIIHQEFKDQLEQKVDGQYETGIIWKPNKDLLPDNKDGSIARLKVLRRRLLRDPKLFDTYEDIIHQQFEEGITEKVEPTESDKKVFYMPHKPVIPQNAESKKVRVVYDASARAKPASLSLNDCLETGPALQNGLRSILIWSRFQPMVLCGDTERAFLQIAIKKVDQDLLWFHWFKNRNVNKLISLRN